jgi:hypothetical protein
MYETQSSDAVACYRPGRAKNLSAPMYYNLNLRPDWYLFIY